jgi:glycosyltransferase involved in cell wall biosynthesis
MKILLLAPHPFYQDRGTPIAVDLLLRVLSERGDEVDLLTYPEGEDRAYPGVTLHRIARPPGVRGIRPGLSAKKILCDLYMLRAALRLTRRKRHDLVHAVEESVFIAMWLRRRRGLPYLFDMDSSMPRQIVDKKPAWRFLLPLMAWCESSAIRRAAGVVAVCDDLAQLARGAGGRRIATLRDISLLPDSGAVETQDLRPELNARGLCLLYLGNLESYQGIGLLLESFAEFRRQRRAEATLVIAGGAPGDIERHRQGAAALGIADDVRFTGPQPLARMAALFRSADVLVSPRIQGGNTPMKIFSYLHSGRAILATRLTTHTQVLDDSVALLAEPDVHAFAMGMSRLAGDAALRQQLGDAARARAERLYTWDVFRKTARAFYQDVENEMAGQRL